MFGLLGGFVVSYSWVLVGCSFGPSFAVCLGYLRVFDCWFAEVPGLEFGLIAGVDVNSVVVRCYYVVFIALLCLLGLFG